MKKSLPMLGNLPGFDPAAVEAFQRFREAARGPIYFRALEQIDGDDRSKKNRRDFLIEILYWHLGDDGKTRLTHEWPYRSGERWMVRADHEFELKAGLKPKAVASAKKFFKERGVLQGTQEVPKHRSPHHGAAPTTHYRLDFEALGRELALALGHLLAGTAGEQGLADTREIEQMLRALLAFEAVLPDLDAFPVFNVEAALAERLMQLDQEQRQLGMLVEHGAAHGSHYEHLRTVEAAYASIDALTERLLITLREGKRLPPERPMHTQQPATSSLREYRDAAADSAEPQEGRLMAGAEVTPALDGADAAGGAAAEPKDAAREVARVAVSPDAFVPGGGDGDFGDVEPPRFASGPNGKVGVAPAAVPVLHLGAALGSYSVTQDPLLISSPRQAVLAATAQGSTAEAKRHLLMQACADRLNWADQMARKNGERDGVKDVDEKVLRAKNKELALTMRLLFSCSTDKYDMGAIRRSVRGLADEHPEHDPHQLYLVRMLRLHACDAGAYGPADLLTGDHAHVTLPSRPARQLEADLDRALMHHYAKGQAGSSRPVARIVRLWDTMFGFGSGDGYEEFVGQVISWLKEEKVADHYDLILKVSVASIGRVQVPADLLWAMGEEAARPRGMKPSCQELVAKLRWAIGPKNADRLKLHGNPQLLQLMTDTADELGRRAGH